MKLQFFNISIGIPNWLGPDYESYRHLKIEILGFHTQLYASNDNTYVKSNTYYSIL